MNKQTDISDLGPEPEEYSPEWVEWRIQRAILKRPALDNAEDRTYLRRKYEGAKERDRRLQENRERRECEEAIVDALGGVRAYR